MKALVTGGAGLIGSHIVERLLERGDEVRIIDSLSPPCHVEELVPAWMPSDVEFIQASVCDKQAMAGALQGVDVVFHLAAAQGLLPEFSLFWQVNSAGTALLYELIVENALPVRKVVISSSQAVYGEGRYRCPEHGPVYPDARSLGRLDAGEWEHVCSHCGAELEPLPTPEGSVRPATMYAQSKYSQETIGFHLGETHRVPTVCLRYAITQGPRQSLHNAYSGVCSLFATRIANGRRPVIYEDGRQTRDYVSVADVANANLFVMDHPGADFEVFNVGTGRAVTVLELVTEIARQLGQSVEPEVVGEFRLGDIRHFSPDVSKLAMLGWRAQDALETTVQRYVEWFVTQGDVPDRFPEAEATMRRQGVIRAVNTRGEEAV